MRKNGTRNFRDVLLAAPIALLVLGATLLAGGAGGHRSQTAFAQAQASPSATCLPGHGYGDKNHCHSGPPGQATAGPTASPSASTTATAQTRPGWGCGDKNHKHSGPPGNPNAKSPCHKKTGGQKKNGHSKHSKSKHKSGKHNSGKHS
jgi:hypothetical protein